MCAYDWPVLISWWQINTCDELVTTELIFSGVLSRYEPAEIVALLSTMIIEEKEASEPCLTARLQQGFTELIGIARTVAEVQHDCGLPVSAEEAALAFRIALMEAVYEWACGMPFRQVAELTDVLEGTIVRCITRLDETCREIRNAARVIGDPVLYKKMERASELIRRDIVFAASLYTV